MENLKRLFGPAPSEIEGNELEAKLKETRRRVIKSLQEFRMKSSPAGKGKKIKVKISSVSKLTEFMADLKDLGMTLEEFKEFAKEQKS